MSSSDLQLPDELLSDILLRLDRKDVLRFRYVSKSWLAIINDRYFMEKHVEHIESSANLSLLIEVNRDRNRLCKLGLTDGDVSGSVVYFDAPLFKFPTCSKTSIVGSCNGLVCLFDKDNRVGVWSPSAKTLHDIPPLPPVQFGGIGMKLYTIVYGFGHDRTSDDYKVIGMSVMCNHDDSAHWGIEARVYSLKTKSWAKKSCSFMDKTRICDQKSYVTFASVTNSIYWIMERNYQNRHIIVAFDLAVDNGYHEVQLPGFNGSSSSDTKNISISLGVLRGCLCLFSTDYQYSSVLWVMKESWTRLISFGDAFLNQQPLMIKPLAYSRSGDKILLQQYDSKLLTSNNVILYDLNSTKTVRVHSFSENLQVDVCLYQEPPDNSSTSRCKSFRYSRYFFLVLVCSFIIYFLYSML